MGSEAAPRIGPAPEEVATTLMAIFLLDTTVIIDALRDRQHRPRQLMELLRSGNILACCPVNIAEIYAGMRPREEAATEALLDSLQMLPILPDVARLTGKLKQEYSKKGATLNLADAMIAATAIYHRAVLITDNLCHFPMPELTLHSLR